jgi:hypothetical protein
MSLFNQRLLFVFFFFTGLARLASARAIVSLDSMLGAAALAVAIPYLLAVVLDRRGTCPPSLKPILPTQEPEATHPGFQQLLSLLLGLLVLHTIWQIVFALTH